MNESLYSISEELIAFMRKVEQAESYDDERADGAVSVDVTTQFEALYEKMGKKMNNMVEYIRSQEDEVAVIDRKIASLQELRKIRTKKIDKLFSLLMFIMQKQWLTEIDTGDNLIKLTESRGSVDVIDESAVPFSYKKYGFSVSWLTKESYDLILKEVEGFGAEYKPAISVDKTAVQNAVKAGEVVPGTGIVKTKKISIV